MPITTEVVSLNPAHGEVYSIQRYVIMWFAEGQWFLSWYSGFLHQLNCNIVESGIKHHNPNPWSDKCSRITSHLALHNNKSINQINHNLLEMISQCMQLIFGIELQVLKLLASEMSVFTDFCIFQLFSMSTYSQTYRVRFARWAIQIFLFESNVFSTFASFFFAMIK